MTDTKHTPGPWQMSGGRRTMAGESFHTVGPDDGGWIAAVLYSDLSMKDHVTSLADARLIASAPDLLEALEAALSCPDGECDETGWRPRANAAIAKARGAS